MYILEIECSAATYNIDFRVSNEIIIVLEDLQNEYIFSQTASGYRVKPITEKLKSFLLTIEIFAQFKPKKNYSIFPV